MLQRPAGNFLKKPAPGPLPLSFRMRMKVFQQSTGISIVSTIGTGKANEITISFQQEHVLTRCRCTQAELPVVQTIQREFFVKVLIREDAAVCLTPTPCVQCSDAHRIPWSGFSDICGAAHQASSGHARTIRMMVSTLNSMRAASALRLVKLKPKITLPVWRLVR